MPSTGVERMEPSTSPESDLCDDLINSAILLTISHREKDAASNWNAKTFG